MKKEIKQDCLGSHSILGAVTKIIYERNESFTHKHKVTIRIFQKLTTKELGLMNVDVAKLESMGYSVEIVEEYGPIMEIEVLKANEIS